MPTEIKLPRLGQGMDEGRILKWLKSEGDSIAKGDEIYEVETEKVNMEVESPATGVLLKIVVGEGDTVPIGSIIAWVGEAGEKVPEVAAAVERAAGNGSAAPISAPAASAAAPVVSAHAPAPAPAPHVPSGGRVKASPLARRVATERGIDLAMLVGSGPEGRIIARDIERAAPAATAAAAPVAVGDGGTRVELSSMRRTIARRLTEAWQAPVFYLSIDVDMTEANALRARLVETIGEGEVRPTVSDIITKASAVALRRVPDVNVHWAGDAIIRYEPVHVGMAVATEGGLVVPVIRNAHSRTIREIAASRKDLVDRARAGRLTMDDMSGGTFSISNLGMMGIDGFNAVLNPPEAAILAVGRTVDRPVVHAGRVVVRPVMSLTATFDHRAVDGAVGARFLQALREHLEEPISML